MEIVSVLIGPDDGQKTALQLSVRALVLLAFGVICVRIAGRKTFAQASPLDIIVALILGSNLSRMMIGNAEFWPSLAATLTLVVASRLLAIATLRWSFLASWIKCSPVVLVRDGVMDLRAMHANGISEADLAEGMRMEQSETLQDVRLATLEGGGKISVVPKQR
ncbi:MAG: DUF421 domain-containing protein [Caulobacteraceae bacterium]